MKINEKHHQRRISTSRRVNIIGQSNFSITFTIRPRGKGTPHSPHSPQPGGLSNDRNPSDGSNIVPRRHTQLRTHARTNETNTISRLDSPPNLRYIYTYKTTLRVIRRLGEGRAIEWTAETHHTGNRLRFVRACVRAKLCVRVRECSSCRWGGRTARCPPARVAAGPLP